MNKQIVVAIVVGFAIGQLGWVDPVFIPLVLAGPVAVGAFAAARGIPLIPVVVLWVTAGLTMLVGDWVVNREDVAFHAVVTVLMSLLASGGWWIGDRFGARRRLA